MHVLIWALAANKKSALKTPKSVSARREFKKFRHEKAYPPKTSCKNQKDVL